MTSPVPACRERAHLRVVVEQVPRFLRPRSKAAEGANLACGLRGHVTALDSPRARDPTLASAPASGGDTPVNRKLRHVAALQSTFPPAILILQTFAFPAFAPGPWFQNPHARRAPLSTRPTRQSSGCVPRPAGRPPRIARHPTVSGAHSGRSGTKSGGHPEPRKALSLGPRHHLRRRRSAARTRTGFPVPTRTPRPRDSSLGRPPRLGSLLRDPSRRPPVHDLSHSRLRRHRAESGRTDGANPGHDRHPPCCRTTSANP
jgi:hypothetical protein